MTREKALELAIRACEETWNEKTCKQIRDALEQEQKTPCDVCIYNPPSSCDGKPCTMCPATTNTEVEE